MNTGDTVTDTGNEAGLSLAGLYGKVFYFGFEYRYDIAGINVLAVGYLSRFTLESFTHSTQTCAVAAIVLHIAGIEDKSTDKVGILAVLDINVLLDEALHDELFQVSLLHFCKGSNVAYYCLDASLLLDEDINIVLQYFRDMVNSLFLYCAVEEFSHAQRKELIYYCFLLVACYQRVSESLCHVRASLQNALGKVDILSGDILADKQIEQFLVSISHLLLPSSSERNSSTSLRFFSSSRLAPTILEAASIARSAIWL